jgi:hypothetical protein
MKEAEIAALIGLGDFVLKELSVSARVVFFGRGPGSVTLF